MKTNHKLALEKVRKFKLVRKYLINTKTFSKRFLIKELNLSPKDVDDIVDKLIELREVRSLGYGLFAYYRPMIKKLDWNLRYY